MATDRNSPGLDKLLGQLIAHPATVAQAEVSELLERGGGEAHGRWILVEEGSGALAVQSAHGTEDLRETQVDQAVELTQACVEILQETTVESHELAQVLESRVDLCGGGPLLRGEASDPQG